MNIDRTAALFFLVFSLFVCQQSVVIGVGTLSQPGPGLLTFGAGAGVGGLAFLLLIQPIVSKERRSEVAPDERTLRKGRFILICLSLFGYTMAVNWLGFLPSTFVFVIFIFRVVESEKWWRTILESVLITIGNYLIFVGWLDLSLPKPFYAW